MRPWLSFERVYKNVAGAGSVGGGWAVVKALLTCLSCLHQLCLRLRTAAYEIGLCRRVRLGCPVISVGNIALGGTGKTPMVRWLAEHLTRKGHSVLVLSRGYGRIGRRTSGIRFRPSGRVVREPESQVENPIDDEAFGIDITGCIASARRSAGAPGIGSGDRAAETAATCADRAPEERDGISPDIGEVFRVVGADRARLAAAALNWLGPRAKGLVAILDDGFQHLRLERDLDIVMVSCFRNSLAGAELFPAGAFREPPKSLSRAQVVVLTHADVCAADAVERTARVVKRLAPRAIVVRSRHRPVGAGSESGVLAAKRVFAFCGIGNPGQFFASLRIMGAEVVGVASFPDHHVFSAADLVRIESEAVSARASAIVTTEKDGMRIEGRFLRLPLHVLSVRLEICDFAGPLEDAIDRVLSRRTLLI